MKVHWSDDAERDLADIIDYIGENNPSAAEKMEALLHVAAARLTDFPFIGRTGILPGTRELIPHPSYRMIYQVRDADIVIHALVHTARQWPPPLEEA